MTSLRSGVKLGLMKKLSQKVTYFMVVYILLLMEMKIYLHKKKNYILLKLETLKNMLTY